MVDKVVKGGKYIYRGHYGPVGAIVIALEDAIPGWDVDVRVEESGDLIEGVRLDHLE